MIVALAKRAHPEPRFQLGDASSGATVSIGIDADVSPGRVIPLERPGAIHPVDSLNDLPAGKYHAQAILKTNPDLNLLNAPGDLYSDVVALDITPQTSTSCALTLEHRISAERVPEDIEQVKYVKLQSPSLSAFHRRPIYLRAAVVLPRRYGDQPDRHYPLRLQIGGYGARYTQAARLMDPGSAFERHWNDAATPRMILVHLDGAGPLGDPYQINSDNHGPYGDALTKELIPHLEKAFRSSGSRVLTGGSTGGWVSLALQVFYPDTFQGAWSFCPDPVDFRSYQKVNIYEDANAYTSADGAALPSCRDPRTGRTRYTMRQECALENVLGLHDTYTLSGQQWGAWNATFGPRGEGGLPVPLWDPRTGAIDRTVLEHWKTYDLRRVLEADWTTLVTKLRGKLHIAIGEADDYFLNEGVHRFEDAIRQRMPSLDAAFEYDPVAGHCPAIPEPTLVAQMARATGAHAE